MTAIAIYGGTCTGKTTIADALSDQFNCNVRHCGELVKAAASSLQLLPQRLSDDDHRSIDEDTRRAVAAVEQEMILVEGNFLNFVLKDRPRCLLIHAVCSDSERRRRYAERNAAVSFDEREREDDDIRERLYRGESTGSADYEIDTTSLSVSESAGRIAKWLKEKDLKR